MSPARPTVQVIGRRLEPTDHLVRDFLTRSAQPYEWLDAESPEAIARLEQAGLNPAEVAYPVVFDQDAILTSATTDRLVETWGYTGKSRSARTTTS